MPRKHGLHNVRRPSNSRFPILKFARNIIDNYNHLPSAVIFYHANRYQWHSDDPLYDGLRMLSRLRIPHIKAQGYVNLRCVWTLGCPIETRPSEEAGKIDGSCEAKAGSFYAEAFSSLFPGQPVPEAIGSPCCAQFTVTGEKIRERPRSDYEAYREWLLKTESPDKISGREMKYSWHCTPLSTFTMVTLLTRRSDLRSASGILPRRCRPLLRSLWSFAILRVRAKECVQRCA